MRLDCKHLALFDNDTRDGTTSFQVCLFLFPSGHKLVKYGVIPEFDFLYMQTSGDLQYKQKGKNILVVKTSKDDVLGMQCNTSIISGSRSGRME